jgi:hypothetical protein
MNAGIFPPSGTTDYTRATRDTTVKASGNSSLKFTIPANSPSDSSGAYFTNFSADLSTQFGENSDFFIQWRQRFSPEFVATKFAGGGGCPRVNDEFTNSFVTMWIARDGQASQQVFLWGPYNLSAGPPGDNQRFGKVWLLPYDTGKDATVTNPVACTWYDELIISTSKIADPPP